MVQLPASIEAYLHESGFSGTELLVLKRLLEGEALSLRELAAKTGKSTGVLDQATKKLIDKKIAHKEVINDSKKFAIHSMDAIKKWVENDVLQRHKVLQRKQQDFEAFLNTVEHDSGRPDMEYFEGKEGIEQAYAKLLDLQEKEWLQFEPAATTEADDPLVENKVELFRSRRRAKTFLRVLAPDTSLGRRFQSRDVFEYRETRLVSEDDFPVGFEKIIAGETVACFESDEMKASFIRYPQLADGQRKLFEILWCSAGKEGAEEECAVRAGDGTRAEADMETQVLSGLREFVMSKKSVVTLALLGVAAAAVTGLLYINNQRLNVERVREKVLAIAATGADYFEPEDISVLRSVSDVYRPEYTSVVEQLMHIQEKNEDVMFTYLLRPTDKEGIYEFIAASDGIDPFAEIDANNDGVINEIDEIVKPGQPYDISEMDALYPNQIAVPAVNSKPYTDQWGTFITGYAPIYNKDGSLNSVLSVDMNAEDVASMTLHSFKPFWYFVGFFLLFVVIRLAAFHRSLLRETHLLLKEKRVLITLEVIVLIAGVLTGLGYYQSRGMSVERMRDQVKAVAATATPLFSADDIRVLRTEADMQAKEYERVVKQLDEIRRTNEGLKYVYIIRPTNEENMYEFVADSYGLNIGDGIDFNNDGKIGPEDEIPVPGMPYDVSEIPGAIAGTVEPIADKEPFTDQWGTFISGFAPIKDANGNTVAVLGIDKIAKTAEELTIKTFHPWRVFFGLFAAFVFIRFAIFHRQLASQVLLLSRRRSVLITLLVCSLIALLITAGMYKYTLELMKDEIGQRLMSIAATAAPTIDADDLEHLRFARDMKRPEYQRVFNKLNEIRDSNEDIEYVYIMRPTSNELIYEFVADADSNFNLDSYIDADNDGKVDNDEINVYPGMMYDISVTPENFQELSLLMPIADEDFSADRWGTFLSGSAPIRNKADEPIALLGIDIEVSDIYNSHKSIFKKYFVFISILLFLLLFRLIFFYQAGVFSSKIVKKGKK